MISKSMFIPFSNKANVTDFYEFKEQLGNGGYGKVFKATQKKSGQQVAIKVIEKSKVDDEDQFRNEFKILKELDHPNIIKLYEIFETTDFLYLVQELCEGGELFYHVIKLKYLTEADAARIMRQIFSAVAYCHSNNICHRDLKPENFLLKKPDDISSIKLIDFGLSKKLSEGEIMSNPNGTVFYIAPEMIRGGYTSAADNWSLGVILYVLLSGVTPFYGKDQKEILKSIVMGHYTFNLKPFKVCSDEVKDLISKLLVQLPDKRYTAMQAYNHPWVQMQVDEEVKNIKIPSSVLDGIEALCKSKDLKKSICYMIALQIPEEEVQEFKNIFVKLDKNGDGFLVLEEFKYVFEEISSHGKTQVQLPEADLKALFNSLDLNNSGKIDYSEFLAIFVMNGIYQYESYLKDIFKKLDLDGDGKISKKELEDFFVKETPFLMNQNVAESMQEVDLNGDGFIDMEELIQHMRSKRSKTLLGK